MVTWLVFKFIFGVLPNMGAPLVNAFIAIVNLWAPQTATQYNQGCITTLIARYVVGFLAKWVIGQRLLHAFDSLLQRIPLVQTIYGGTKKLLDRQKIALAELPALLNAGSSFRSANDNFSSSHPRNWRNRPPLN